MPSSPPLKSRRRIAARSARRLALPPAGLLLAAVLLTGCGGSSHSAGTSADPASVVPSSAPVYAGAVVQPTGSQRTGALAAGNALTHQANPYLRLLAVLETPGSPKLSYAHDVAPWVGPKAGIFLTSLASAEPLLTLLEQGLTGGSGARFPFGPGGAQGAIVMDTGDPAGASNFLTGQAQRAGARPQTYRGVSYEATTGGLAFGLVDRFAVIGSQTALRSVIDTTQGGTALSAAGSYGKLMSVAPSGALAHVYVNPLAQTAAGAGTGTGTGTGTSGGEAQGTGLLSLLTGPRPANVSLIAKAGSLSLDADTFADTAGTGGGTAGSQQAPEALLSASPEAAQVLGGLPGQSWLAIGLAQAGSGLTGDIRGLQGLGSLLKSPAEAPGSLSLGSVLEGLLTPLEALGAPTAQARHDFGRWIGPAGVFASGSSLLELQAAVVIDSTDAKLSRAAVAKLGQALRKRGAKTQPASLPGTEAVLDASVPGLPLALYIAAGRSSEGQAKFVLGLGEASVGAALNPPSTLSAAASRAAAAASIGEGAQPSLMLDTPTLLSLLESAGLTESPSLSGFLPYLRSITTVAGGGHELTGEINRYRVTVNLAQSEPAEG